jgi:hypothetical protein
MKRSIILWASYAILLCQFEYMCKPIPFPALHTKVLGGAWYAVTVSIGNRHEPILVWNDLIPEIAGPGAVVVDDELDAQGFDHHDEIASYFWVYIPSIMVYEDNWLRSEATDRFDQYHELLTE